MKEFFLGLTFLFLLAAVPLSWWVNYRHEESVAMAIRYLSDAEALDREAIAAAFRISEGDRAGGGMNNAIARRMIPQSNLTWKWIGLPAIILLIVNAFYVIKSAGTGKQQNKSGEGAA